MLHFSDRRKLGVAEVLQLLRTVNILFCHMTITPIELKSRLDKQKDFRLIDVREADEWAVAKLPEAELIPLSQFQQLATQQLSPEETIILYCHHGMRSARAQGFLKAQGFANVINLTGGIDAWSVQVDPSVKRY